MSRLRKASRDVHNASSESQFEALKADFARYGPRALLREPSSVAVAIYRFGRWNDQRERGFASSFCRVVYLLGFMLVRVSLNIEIPKEALIGPGLRIYHQGPVVVHPETRAGSNLTLRHGVTIGERRRGAGVPILGDSVELGAYSQILGPIHVGNSARVGAMALVLKDVDPGAVVLAPVAHAHAGQSIDVRESL